MGDDPPHVSGPGRLHHRVEQRITERHPRRILDEGWYYPPLEMLMKEEGFEYMAEYVLKRQNTVAQYIAMRPVLGL